MFKNILIAVDGSKHSQKAEEVGIELAKISNGKITALYVVEIGKEYGAVGMAMTDLADKIVEGNKKYLMDIGNQIMRQTEERAKKAGIPFQGNIIEGHAATEILRMTEDAKMNLIVIGSLERTGLSRYLLGSAAESVIRNSKVPVLVVY
ncbi:MAG: universal stress protein [Methanotrichaceae archaeon]|nr:universal stress protein [Methanotrichaceae archaeon]